MVVARSRTAADDYRRAMSSFHHPEPLRAGREPRGRGAVMLALLLDENTKVQVKQHAEIAARLGPRDRGLRRPCAAKARCAASDAAPALAALASLCCACARVRSSTSCSTHPRGSQYRWPCTFRYVWVRCCRSAARSLDPSRHAPFGRQGRRRQARGRDPAGVVAQAGHDNPPCPARLHRGLQRVRRANNRLRAGRKVCSRWKRCGVLNRLNPAAKQLMGKPSPLRSAMTADQRERSRLLRPSAACCIVRCRRCWTSIDAKLEVGRVRVRQGAGIEGNENVQEKYNLGACWGCAYVIGDGAIAANTVTRTVRLIAAQQVCLTTYPNGGWMVRDSAAGPLRP